MTTFKLVGASGLALVALAGGAVVILARAPVSQPIAFNHRVHLKDAGMACPDCHVHALDGVRATIPNVEVCASCHDKAQGKSAAEAAVVEHVRTKQPIPWRKVYLVPDHVYFSHRRHTTLGGIKCETCHGAIGDRTQPVGRQLVPVAMDRCVGCHVEKGALNDCVGCHR
jgi:hypothetical protein